jgi:hypothetical protein
LDPKGALAALRWLHGAGERMPNPFGSPRPVTSHSTLVWVASQMARTSETVGSDLPRNRLRRAPSERWIAPANALALP